MRVIRASIIAVVVGSAGCSDAASNGWTVSEQKSSGGVSHVVNVPPADGIRPTWKVEPEVRIGEIEGTGPDVFGQVRGLVIDAQGRMIVLDAAAQELRVFAPDGRHLRTMGKKGAGPGEFSGANGMVIGHDDVVRVNDPQNKRISLFSADSGFVTSFAIDVRSYGWVWRAMIDTALVTWESTLIARDSSYIYGLKGYDAQGRWTDTILDEPLDMNRTNPGSYSWRTATGGGVMSVPFWPTRHELMDSKRFYWSTEATNEYRITRTTLQRDTVLILEAKRPLVAVSAHERDSAIAAVRKSAGQQDWSLIPEYKPLIRQLFLSDEGDLWVSVETGDAASTTYDVFGGDGRYKGTAVINARVERWVSPIVRSHTFWAIVRDDLDVAYVIRGRLTPAEQN